MRLRFCSIAAGVFLTTLVAPHLAIAQQPAQRTTLAEFRTLSWLTGAWRGSGGSYAAFYEEYRAIDDSTIAMRSFTDSTFRVVSDSSTIAWRNGIVVKRGSGTPAVAIELSGRHVRFRRPGALRGGFTFTRDSADQWTATLHPASPDGRETVYVMRRLRW